VNIFCVFWTEVTPKPISASVTLKVTCFSDELHYASIWQSQAGACYFALPDIVVGLSPPSHFISCLISIAWLFALDRVFNKMFTLNDLKRIRGTVVYMRPFEWQASLRGHDIVRKYELVAVGHRFGKVSVLATMWGNFYPKKLEQTSNADRLKFNNRSAQINMNLIEEAIVAFVRSLLGNFRKTRKLQTVQTHKTQLQKVSWHTRYNPSVSTCGPTFNPQHWHLSLRGVQCWRGDVHHVVVNCVRCSHFIFETCSTITWAIIRSSRRYHT